MARREWFDKLDGTKAYSWADLNPQEQEMLLSGVMKGSRAPFELPPEAQRRMGYTTNTSPTTKSNNLVMADRVNPKVKPLSMADPMGTGVAFDPIQGTPAPQRENYTGDLSQNQSLANPELRFDPSNPTPMPDVTKAPTTVTSSNPAVNPATATPTNQWADAIPSTPSSGLVSGEYSGVGQDVYGGDAVRPTDAQINYSQSLAAPAAIGGDNAGWQADMALSNDVNSLAGSSPATGTAQTYGVDTNTGSEGPGWGMKGYGGVALGAGNLALSGLSYLKQKPLLEKQGELMDQQIANNAYSLAETKKHRKSMSTAFSNA